MATTHKTLASVKPEDREARARIIAETMAHVAGIDTEDIDYFVFSYKPKSDTATRTWFAGTGPERDILMNAIMRTYVHMDETDERDHKGE